MTSASRRVFLTGQPTILEPTEFAFGHSLGGAAPILDEDGRLLGVAGVTIDNSLVFSTVRHLFVILISTCALLMVFIFLFLSRFSHLVLDPLLKDKLTGAYNKRYFDSLLQDSINHAIRSNQDLSLLMLDLDHFKIINDTYGHPFGDVVLAKVSGLVKNCLRGDDYLFRYGGEEFVMLLKIAPDKATMVAERIRKAVENFELRQAENGVAVKLTVSIGVANLGRKRMSAKELVSASDKALYKAKETRNAVALIMESGLPGPVPREA
jgi:diguanylate cyclase (GGDEF)-like protein